ncbi:BEN domain-containing protein 5-like [Ornithodoros turicata]|uniref:BEN domain-containing protein 5-like n=1 Tax=Ornithodoros turicata TaxID=34597 RepID=UPI003138E711
MRDILRQKLAEKRAHPVIEYESEVSDSDDGAVVPQKLYDELQERYAAMKAQVRELKSKASSSPSMMEDHLKAISTTLARVEEKIDQHEYVSPETTMLSEPPLKKANFQTDGVTVTINETVSMPLDQWLHCQRESFFEKESLFVRSMALALWGKDTLKNRSTEGRVSNRLRKQPEATAKPQLSPEKIGVLEDCFEDWPVKRGASGPCLKERLNSLKGHLISALRDAARPAKDTPTTPTNATS